LVGEGCTSLGFLLDSVRDYYQGKLIYLETRNFFDYKNFRSDFSAAGWSYIPYLNVKVQIKDRSLDEIISLFNYNRRRQVRKSLAEGATWTEVNTVSRIQAIYRILFHLYKTKVRLPLPPEDFFIKFWQSGLMKAFAVEHNGKIIGGSFSPVLPGKCVYTMYYCGERDYHPRIFPTHLAVLAVMDYGQKAGCRYLDFMGAGKPGVEYGVRNYKMEFGGDLIEEGRYLLVLNPFMYKLGKLGLTMLSRKGV
jgi:lipid II:glycine glycyltransferase (peptidoglycan interpeptide bridge formation enzyme)